MKAFDELKAAAVLVAQQLAGPKVKAGSPLGLARERLEKALAALPADDKEAIDADWLRKVGTVENGSPLVVSFGVLTVADTGWYYGKQEVKYGHRPRNRGQLRMLCEAMKLPMKEEVP